MKTTKSKSVVLLSGGLDSLVALRMAQEESEVELALSILYGQRHSREMKSALAITEKYDLVHRVVDMGMFGLLLNHFRATALTDPNEQLPHNRTQSEMPNSVPRSYVPGRNTIMLALAQSLAEAANCSRIYTGFNAVDYSGYVDCRTEFVRAWNHLARFATSRGVAGDPITLHAPLVNLTKADIVRLGLDLDAPFELSWSCYQGGDRPCGQCDSCIIRWNAFKENGMSDPAGEYEVTPV